MDSSELKVLKNIHRKYGVLINQIAPKYGIPAEWLYGLIQAETAGDQYSCSRCQDCKILQPACFDYPKCPGKSYAPCAYGLTQITPGFLSELMRRKQIPKQDSRLLALSLLDNPAAAIEFTCMGIRNMGKKDFNSVLSAYHGGYLSSYHNRANAVAKEAVRLGYTNRGGVVSLAIMAGLAVGSVWLMRETLRTRKYQDWG